MTQQEIQQIKKRCLQVLSGSKEMGEIAKKAGCTTQTVRNTLHGDKMTPKGKRVMAVIIPFLLQRKAVLQKQADDLEAQLKAIQEVL